MDCQDWTPVVSKRRATKKEAAAKGQLLIQPKDSGLSERVRLAKLDSSDYTPVKKRVNPESLQELIRKRIEMKLTQDKADALCLFPKHTFKNIESHRIIPTEEQKRAIRQNFNINIKIDTEKSNTVV